MNSSIGHGGRGRSAPPTPDGPVEPAAMRPVNRLPCGRSNSIFIIVALLFASRAPAQTTGTVSGAIEDANGGALPGVTVTMRNVDTSLVRSAVTDENGRFVVAGIPVGRYEVRAELSGFKPLVRKDLALVVGQTAVLALTMQVGGVDEEITVSGQASPINTRSAELSYLVSAETIEQLPLNGRNYTDLLLLQPGVNAFPHRDGGSAVAHGLAMSVNGQDPRSNVYLLDGTLQNDFTNGPAGQRRRHRARHGDGPRIPRRVQCLQRRVRPQHGRSGQRPHQVRHQRPARQRVRVPPQ